MIETSPTQIFPVLPLRDIVVFPHMIVPLFVGRDKSVRALEDVMKDDKQILLVAQKNASQDDPGEEDIHNVGTIASVLQLLKLPDGTVKVLVEGVERAKIESFIENEEFFQAHAEVIEEKEEETPELEALARSVIAQFEQYVKLNRKVPPEVLVSLNQIDEPSKLADTMASHMALKIAEKQELLEIEGAADVVLRTSSGGAVAMQTGNVTYMGGWGDDDALDVLIGNLCAGAGLTTLSMAEGVRIRDTATERFWFNYSNETVTTEAGTLPPAGVLRVELA